jgi:hypothetical protein
VARGWKKAGAPLWAVACEYSEVWGVPPWEIWAKPGAARWLNRMRVWREETAAARDDRPAPRIDGEREADKIREFQGDIPYAEA